MTTKFLGVDSMENGRYDDSRERPQFDDKTNPSVDSSLGVTDWSANNEILSLSK